MKQPQPSSLSFSLAVFRSNAVRLFTTWVLISSMEVLRTTAEIVGGPGCCSWDLKTCKTCMQYCNKGEYECSVHCSGFWIQTTLSASSCVAHWDGNCDLITNDCCQTTALREQTCQPDSYGSSSSCQPTKRDNLGDCYSHFILVQAVPPYHDIRYLCNNGEKLDLHGLQSGSFSIRYLNWANDNLKSHYVRMTVNGAPLALDQPLPPYSVNGNTGILNFGQYNPWVPAAAGTYTIVATVFELGGIQVETDTLTVAVQTV